MTTQVVGDQEVAWVEPFPMLGTCPRCGAGDLRLVQDLWIPPHFPAGEVTEGWKALPGISLDSVCPIHPHTQAVEDGGVVVELDFIAKFTAQARKLWKDQHEEAGTSETCKGEGCEACDRLHFMLSCAQACYHEMAQRWSKPNPRSNELHTDISAGISFWRDREPFLLKAIGTDVQASYALSVAQERARTPSPTLELLHYLEGILRDGVRPVGSSKERYRLVRLRAKGLVRKLVNTKACQYFTLTARGVYVISKYLLGHKQTMALVNQSRSSWEGAIELSIPNVYELQFQYKHRRSQAKEE